MKLNLTTVTTEQEITKHLDALNLNDYTIDYNNKSEFGIGDMIRHIEAERHLGVVIDIKKNQLTVLFSKCSNTNFRYSLNGEAGKKQVLFHLKLKSTVSYY